MGKKFTKNKNVIPGYRLSMAVTMSILCLVVLIPMASLVISASGLSFNEFIALVTSDIVVASYKVSFGCAFIAALINSFFGLILAWVLVRYDFIGKRLLDGLIELPCLAHLWIALTSCIQSVGWEVDWLS